MSTSKTHHTAVFGRREYTRVSEHVYPYAAFNLDRYRITVSAVSFHKTYAAAKRRAGRFGHVVETTRRSA